MKIAEPTNIENAIDLPDDFNMSDYFVFANLEAGRGDKTAIIFEGREITYREVADNVTRVARSLIANGLLPEQRVLLVLQDRPEFVYAWFGAIKAGAVVTQINPSLPPADYEYFLSYVKPQFVFVDEAAWEAFSPAVAQSRYCGQGTGAGGVVTVGVDQPPFARFEEWVTGGDDSSIEPWPTRKDDAAVWLFTSGSTGKSKAAVHSHAHFPFNTEVYAKRFIGIHETDITLSGPRLFFGYATGTNLMFPFSVGATTILDRAKPDPARLCNLIDQYKPTVFTSVPTLINKMLELPEVDRRDLSSLRFMWSAGEALPIDVHERWDKAFGVPIIDGIGSAESFHIYISNKPGAIKPGSLGRLVPGYEAKLLDDEGMHVGDGDVGTLWLGGPSAALYYHGAYEKSTAHLRGGWIVSGDKFRQDKDGFWFYEGRADDLIKSGGIYVSPLEVENCLLQHEGVLECCVIGREDENKLEKPAAIVVVRDDFEQCDGFDDELIAFVKERLARYKAPRWIRIERDRLPRNDRDKIDRKRLKAEWI